LLDPNIPNEKICTTKPTGIVSSATFVVDIRQLKCIDDVKTDEFGIWKYSGSHPTAYEVKVHDDLVEVEKCIVVIVLETTLCIYDIFIAHIHPIKTSNG